MLREIKKESLLLLPFEKIGKDWMLVTAGDETKHNTMTAAWGGLGVLFGLDVSYIFLRPERYTKQFVDENAGYSLCFFDETYRKALSYCGSVSGRDVDKDRECGLTVRFDGGIPYYEEASLVLICRKVYHAPLLSEGFVDKKIDETMYRDGGYHEFYVGEIVKVFSKE